MPLCFKATYRWSAKLVRVSSPLKLRKTSYFHRDVEDENDDEEEAFRELMEDIGDMLAASIELQ